MICQDRLKIANEFIQIISKHGRRFFKDRKTDFVGHFKIKKKRIYFVDDYTRKEVYLHYEFWSFSHGGTLKHLVNMLKEYIQGKRDLPLNLLELTAGGVDIWGYGKEAMDKVRNECSLLVV